MAVSLSVTVSLRDMSDNVIGHAIDSVYIDYGQSQSFADDDFDDDTMPNMIIPGEKHPTDISDLPWERTDPPTQKPRKILGRGPMVSRRRPTNSQVVKQKTEDPQVGHKTVSASSRRQPPNYYVGQKLRDGIKSEQAEDDPYDRDVYRESPKVVSDHNRAEGDPWTWTPPGTLMTIHVQKGRILIFIFDISFS